MASTSRTAAPEDLRPEGEQAADLERQADDDLAVRHLGEHVVQQLRRSAGRLPGRARGAQEARLAAEGQDGLVPTSGAAQAGEAGRGQAGVKRALDEPGQRGAGLLPAGAEEVPQLLADDPVESGVLRAMPLAMACHGRWQSSPRAAPRQLIVFASKGKRPLSRRDLPDILRVKQLSRAAFC